MSKNLINNNSFNEPENRSAECASILRLFLFFRREEIMLVHYKKNKKPACYDSHALITIGRIPPDERPHGPFKSCGNCPYPSHGFICYSSEGDCLKTDMQRIHNKNKQKKEELT
jgi:hypothetical protein